MNTPQDITLNILKNKCRSVDFTQMIKKQQEFVTQARRTAGSKPSKVEQAYIAEQEVKLSQLEDIVKRWIWQAFENEEDVVEKTMYWHNIEKNFTITVLVEKK